MIRAGPGGECVNWLWRTWTQASAQAPTQAPPNLVAAQSGASKTAMPLVLAVRELVSNRIGLIDTQSEPPRNGLRHTLASTPGHLASNSRRPEQTLSHAGHASERRRGRSWADPVRQRLILPLLIPRSSKRTARGSAKSVAKLATRQAKVRNWPKSILAVAPQLTPRRLETPRKFAAPTPKVTDSGPDRRSNSGPDSIHRPPDGAETSD